MINHRQRRFAPLFIKQCAKNIILGLTLCIAAMTANAQSQVPYAELNNGLKMPLFGIGTYQDPGDSITADAVSFALKNGYRHIDTAHAYLIERGVGQGIKDSGVPREEIWLTSKIWPSEYGEGKTTEAIDKMLERLGVDYVDLLYVHQPWAIGVEPGVTWRKLWKQAKSAR